MLLPPSTSAQDLSPAVKPSAAPTIHRVLPRTLPPSRWCVPEPSPWATDLSTEKSSHLPRVTQLESSSSRQALSPVVCLWGTCSSPQECRALSVVQDLQQGHSGASLWYLSAPGRHLDAHSHGPVNVLSLPGCVCIGAPAGILQSSGSPLAAQTPPCQPVFCTE